MVNQIPAIINTNPQEPKSSKAEITVKLDIQSIIPSNNFGKEQWEIQGMAEEIDRYYSKKYWIPKAGFEKPEMGKSYSASLRRRRLGQTKEGVIKEGRNEDGSFIKHNWDWEIMELNSLDSKPQDAHADTPWAITEEEKQMSASQELQEEIKKSIPSTATKDQQIARAVAFKGAIDIEIAKLDNKITDGADSLSKIIENSDIFFDYLTQ